MLVISTDSLLLFLGTTRCSVFVLFFFFTALFNNMRTLKFKAQPTNAFFATVKCSAAPPSFRLLFRCLNCAQRFDYRALGSRRKPGGGGGTAIYGLYRYVPL